MAVRGCRIRRAARQELLLLRIGCVPYPRAAGPGERALLCLPGAHRHQSLRGTGVRTISGQPGHPAHYRREADPRRRLPPGSFGRRRGRGTPTYPELFTLANAVDRREPRLDPAHLPSHAEGVVLLTGGRDGRLSRLALEGRCQEARELPEGLHEVVRLGVRIRGDPAELPEGRHRTQPGACQAGPGHGGAGRGHQRRALSHPREVQAPAGAGGGQAKQHHRPGPPLYQAQSPSAPEVTGPDGSHLQGLSRGHFQHPPYSGAVRLRPQHRPGL